MHNPLGWMLGVTALIATSFLLEPHEAFARPLYLKVFKETFPSRTDIARCAVCHFQQQKTVLTEYGKAVGEALGARNVKDEQAIVAALLLTLDKLPRTPDVTDE